MTPIRPPCHHGYPAGRTLPAFAQVRRGGVGRELVLSLAQGGPPQPRRDSDTHQAAVVLVAVFRPRAAAAATPTASAAGLLFTSSAGDARRRLRLLLLLLLLRGVFRGKVTKQRALAHALHLVPHRPLDELGEILRELLGVAARTALERTKFETGLLIVWF